MVQTNALVDNRNQDIQMMSSQTILETFRVIENRNEQYITNKYIMYF